jgi:hypothetical protein
VNWRDASGHIALWNGTTYREPDHDNFSRFVDAGSQVQRDVEGYAIAACLTKQNEPYLTDQGDAWASGDRAAIAWRPRSLPRGAGAVESELKKGVVPAIRNEQDPQHAKPVPVLYCAEIIDEPAVRTAIDKAIKKLAPTYRRAKKK